MARLTTAPALAALLLLACAAPRIPPPPPGLVEVRRVTAPGGAARAHFGRAAGDPMVPGVPLEFQVEALWFTLRGDPLSHPFRPRGEVQFSDWGFDIFSPDGAHVLLLQDRFGPYHVVRTPRLREYLEGGPPDEVVQTAPAARDGFGPVHRAARWRSAHELEYEAAGQRVERVRYRLRRAR